MLILCKLNANFIFLLFYGMAQMVLLPRLIIKPLRFQTAQKNSASLCFSVWQFENPNHVKHAL